MTKYSEKLTNLMVEVLQTLHGNTDDKHDISDILKRMCAALAFGYAFVYESDHTRKFYLHECSAAAEHIKLLDSFMLNDWLSTEQIKHLTDDPIYCVDSNAAIGSVEKTMLDLFAANSLYMIFMFDSNNDPIGCVGMADKRHHYALTAQEYTVGGCLLNGIAERSRLRIYKQRLNYTANTLHNIMDHTGFDIYVNDYETHEMLYANDSMTKPYGGWKNFEGRKCYEALYKDQTCECEFCPKKHLIDDKGNPSKIYSWDYQRPFDKTWWRVISAAFRWVDGRLAQVISSSDITDAKNNELFIQHMAFYDALTGLPNRRKLEDDFESLIENNDKNPNGSVLLFFDLNKFKQVNDIHGHQVGDALLRHIANVLQASPITKDHCYRYGGDEFVLLYGNTNVAEAATLSKQITDLLKTPYVDCDLTIPCGGSVGFAHYPNDGDEFRTILETADARMYQIKQAANMAR